MLSIILNIFIFLLIYGSQFSFATSDTTFLTTTKKQSNYTRSIPDLSKWGKITEKQIEPTGNKFIYFILDAHANPKTQKNISQIIHKIVNHHTIDLIGIEGARGQINKNSLNYFLNIDNSYSESLLDTGLLTGVELWIHQFSLDQSIPVYGLEDKKTYLQNFSELVDVFSMKRENEKILKSYQRLITSLKQKVYQTDKLINFDAIYSSYNCKETSRYDYLKYILDDKSLLENIKKSKFTSLKKMLDIMYVEEKIDFKKIHLSLNRLIESKDKVPLLIRNKYFKSEKVIYDDQRNPRWIDLFRDCKDYFPKKDQTFIQNYIDYLKLINEIKANTIKFELWLFSYQNSLKLAQSKVEKLLIEHDQFFLFYEMISSLTLSKEHYEYLNKNQFMNSITYKIENLLKLSKQEKIHSSRELKGYKYIIKQTYQSAMSYYKTLHRRDSIMFYNLINYLDQLKASNAILITGGFHYKGIVSLLNQTKTSYLVITPKVGPATNLYKKTMLGLSPSITRALDQSTTS